MDNTTMGAWVFETSGIYIPSWCEGPYTVTIYAEVDSTSSTQATSARFDDVTLNGNTIFFAEDSLGTSRVLTDVNGVVCYDADFYPYGGERTYTNNCTSHYKFEGKERDVETGNDDFGSRYYSNRFGRWLSADWSAVPVAVPYANLTNPQTLNLYSIVADDPESFADLDGHCGEPISFTICVGVVILGVEAIYNHFHELHAKAESARAAQEFQQACASSPQCDLNTVHQQTESALREAGQAGAETALTTVPIVAPPNGLEELVHEAGAGIAKDAAAEASKPKEQQQQQKQNENQQQMSNQDRPQEGRKLEQEQKQRQQPNQPPPPPPPPPAPPCRNGASTC